MTLAESAARIAEQLADLGYESTVEVRAGAARVVLEVRIADTEELRELLQFFAEHARDATSEVTGKLQVTMTPKL